MLIQKLSFMFEMGAGSSLIFYLAALVTGLMLIIALVMICRPLGGVRVRHPLLHRARHLRASRRTEARFEGGSQEVQLRGRQVPEPVPLRESLVPAMVEEEMPPVPSCCFEPFSRDCHTKREVASVTHPGIKRQYKPNEDSLFALEGLRFQRGRPQPFAMFLVADGMGGHLYGREASRLSIQMMIDRVLPTLCGNDELKEADFRRLLIEGVLAANRAIYQRNMERGTTMGTTLTAAVVVDSTAFVANVGDSRTYLYRATEGLRQVTKDHSVVGYLVEHGIIQRDDIYTHPQRNQVYRSLGNEAVLAVDTFAEPLQPGDTMLLCSDGLWEMVRNPLIEQTLREETDSFVASQALLQAALTGGGEDNISLIVAQIGQATECGDRPGVRVLAWPDTVEFPPRAQHTLRQSS